jgi:hypothetical protein
MSLKKLKPLILGYSLLILLFTLASTAFKKFDKLPLPHEEYYTMDDYYSVLKYDTHVHIRIYDTTFIQNSLKDNFKLLVINNESPFAPPIQEQQNIAVSLIHKYPGKVFYATTFSVKNWNDPHWKEQTINYINNSIHQGAIAVKVWKNIGMDLRDKNGKLVMIDDPRFDPVIDFLANNKIPLIGHLGESKNTWMPLNKMTVRSTRMYDSIHPQYHMYLHPDMPSYEQQVAARDHMLDKHLNLTFIGAHLGSLEWSVDELAKRLDKYPNMAVDMAERIAHFQYQSLSNWKRVRDFIIKYQDRLIYATDLTIDASKSALETSKHAHEVRLADWKYFTSNEKMHNTLIDGEFRGLKLPRPVIDKIYRLNAEKWFSGFTNKKRI